MPRSRKKSGKGQNKEITIHSNETQILIGLIVLLVGIAISISPFVDATLMDKIKLALGYSAVAWGLTIIYFSVRFLTQSDRFKSNVIFLSAILFSLNLSIFLSIWVPKEEAQEYETLIASGGLLGTNLHQYLESLISKPIELILSILIFIITFSFITGISLESIRDGFSKILNRSGSKQDRDDSDILPGEYIEDLNKDKLLQSKEKVDEYINDNSESFENTSVDSTGQESFDTQESEDENDEAEDSDEFISNGNSGQQSDENDGDEAQLFGEPKFTSWKYPASSLLLDPVKRKQNPQLHERNASIIEKTLRSFGVQSKVTNISVGPTVVQYALSITVGTKVSKVRNLANDLALALAAPASTVRIEAPIPGTSLIGIEVPNPTPNFVYVKELVQEIEKSTEKYQIPLILGQNVAGKSVIRDLAEQPHILVAGATGTGKSVGINSILIGMLMTMSPDELRLILVDPKMVEMSPYNDIPHLLTPVITDMELVVNALQWATEEMLRRYRLLKQLGVRKIAEYNAKIGYNAMPYIVIVIDEMADLMLSTGVDVESKIVRLTQMSRATGIHLILATQRPSVDVITGLIKANVPGRIGYSVATAIDSRVIIDQVGAETLIGKGDMLFKSPATPRPVRIQGAYTDIKDIENVVNFVREQAEGPEYAEEVTQPKIEVEESNSSGDQSEDPLFRDAVQAVVNAQKASSSMLQRKLRVGYNRAARLMDELEAAQIVGPQEGSNPRKVLISDISQVFGNEDTE